ALDRYSIEAGLAGRVSETAGGARGGVELDASVEHASRMRNSMAFVPRRYDPAIIEASASAGALDPDLSADARVEASARTARWSDRGDTEARWTAGLSEEGGYHIQRQWRGVTDHHIIEPGFSTSAEARKSARSTAETAEVYSATARSVRASAAAVEPEPAVTAEESEQEAAKPRAEPKDAITRPSESLDAVSSGGRKGSSIKRYKGSGEMNPQQLRETTMSPASRSSIRITSPPEYEGRAAVKDSVDRSMGRNPEHRFMFIQNRASEVDPELIDA
ncbi:hypothetical protein OY671_007662, partial [Metschnikowia pulcherrima]